MADWTKKRVMFAPEFSAEQRAAITARGYLCRGLRDYVALFSGKHKQAEAR